MMDLILLGLYVPIIAFSAPAFVFFFTRLLWPAWQDRMLTIHRFALGIAAALSLISHFGENVTYGLARWFPDQLGWLAQSPYLIVLWKLMVLGGSMFALIALSRETRSGTEELKRLMAIATMLTGAAMLVAIYARG